MPPSILAVVGPTASGKTALGIALAQRLKGAVLSADSRQVYAGFNIGTAKPKAAWRDDPHAATEPELVDGVPHYLLNVCAPTNTYTLADWLHSTEQITNQSSTPLLLVGGTMLYVDSFITGFSLPPVAPNEVLRQTLEEREAPSLYGELLARDPAAGTFIEPQNKRRIIRALEVMDATGQPFSKLRQRSTAPATATIIGLFPGWDELKVRIAARAEAMLAQGLVEEVQVLRQRYGAALPLLTILNYQQAAALLDGQSSREEAAASMIRATMRYAHRQMSWWKRNKTIRWFAAPDEIDLSALLATFSL